MGWHGRGPEVTVPRDVEVVCDDEVALEPGLVVGELEWDSGYLMFTYRGRVEAVKLKAKGGQWHPKGHAGTVDPESLAAVRQTCGVQADSFRDKLAHERFWLYTKRVAGGPQLPGHFDDVRGSSRLQPRRPRPRARRLRLERQRTLPAAGEYRPDRFFNPFAFVPVPEEPAERERPIGHLSRAAGTLSGHIDFAPARGDAAAGAH